MRRGGGASQLGEKRLARCPGSASQENLERCLEGSLTIAICSLTPEGVVLGADSTASFMVPEGGFHYLNFNQKLFQIGEDSTLAALTWGLAPIPLT
jgi:hypothetical protein